MLALHAKVLVAKLKYVESFSSCLDFKFWMGVVGCKLLQGVARRDLKRGDLVRSGLETNLYLEM